MRLNRYVAAGSHLSRRAADEAIVLGRVKINGQPATLGMDVQDADEVWLDDVLIVQPTSFRYVVMNKPVGYVVSRAKQDASPTIYDLLPPELAGLNPVGRLDKDSSGLLLLSDDGEFVHRAAHPSGGKEKVYQIQLDRTPTRHELKQFEAGVALEDGISRVRIIAAGGDSVTLGLGEGRNRQIRRTAEAVGFTVKKLHRTQFGALNLGALAAGKHTLTNQEPTL